MSKKQSPALHFLLHAWDSIPGGSYQRLNHGMYNALRTAIESGMRFDEGDILKLPGTGRWITDGGEGLHGLACGDKRGSENISAAIALEKWLGRPGVLWAESTKKATRLHVGEIFTWKGMIVTVTSMASDALVACTYTQEYDRGSNGDPKVGQVGYFANDYRSVVARKDRTDGSVIFDLSAPIENERKIDRRFKITYAELAAARKAYDTRRKGYDKRFAAATTLTEVVAIATAASAEGRRAFRHFDIEMLQEAIKASKERIKDGMTSAERAAALEEEQNRLEVSRKVDMQRWLAGEDVHRHFDVVRLRIKDGYVETSTGQRASVESAKKALTFIKLMRKKPAGWKTVGDPDAPKVDLFEIVSITVLGVQVGCTFVPMDEIDRIEPLLKKAA